MQLVCPQCEGLIDLPDDFAEPAVMCPNPECGHVVQTATGDTMVVSTAQAQEPEDEVDEGEILNGYQVQGPLGRGGMASVYLGNQLSLDRSVAIKVLQRRLAEDPEFVARFHREAGALAGLNHPNVISIIDRGEKEGLFYFVMEYVDGTSLRDIMDQRRLPPEDVLETVIQVCSALQYAHEMSIVHRDIKPANILITKDGRLKVADFGIAHIAGGDGQTQAAELTVDNVQMGTMNYMSPEQRTNAKDVDLRSDLYSLGVMLYEMLTGQLPLGRFELPSKLNSDLDARIDRVIEKCLKSDREQRYQNAEELTSDLKQVLAGQQPAAPPTSSDTSITMADSAAFACRKCSAVNPPDLRYCQACGHDLFQRCYKCRKEVRIGAKFCSSCRANLHEHRDTELKKMEGITKVAEQHFEKGRLDPAVVEFQKIERNRFAEFEPQREEAQKRITEIRGKKKELEQDRDTRVQNAEAAVKERNYTLAVEILQSIPEGLRDQSIGERLEQVQGTISRIAELDKAWKTMFAKKRYVAAYTPMKELLELQPGRQDLAKRFAEVERLRADRETKRLATEINEAIGNGDFDDAHRRLQEIFKVHPDKEKAGKILGPLRAKINKERDAQCKRLLAEAQELLDDGDFDEALELAEQAQRLDENDLEVRRLVFDTKQAIAKGDRRDAVVKKFLIISGIVIGLIVIGGIIYVCVS